MVENSTMHSFSAPASCAVKCLRQQPTIWMENGRRDENDVPRVPIVSLTPVAPGAVTVHQQ